MKMAHVHEILIIENQNFPVPWHREAFEYDLTKNDFGRYWTLYLNDEIVGYGGLWLVDSIAHLTTLCVAGLYKGRGIGKWMLLEIMKRGSEMGADRFTLEVRESNIPAIKLYERAGYRVVGKRENYYAEIHEDALIMWTGDAPYET